MFVVRKYVAYLVFEEENPNDFTVAFEVGSSPMPAIFEEQQSFPTARKALSEARKYANENNNQSYLL